MSVWTMLTSLTSLTSLISLTSLTSLSSLTSLTSKSSLTNQLCMTFWVLWLLSTRAEKKTRATANAASIQMNCQTFFFHQLSFTFHRKFDVEVQCACMHLLFNFGYTLTAHCNFCISKSKQKDLFNINKWVKKGQGGNFNIPILDSIFQDPS